MTVVAQAAAAAAIALVVARLAAGALAKRAAKLALVDRPGERKPQPAPVPLVGGIAVLGGAAAGIVVAASLSGELRHFLDPLRLLPPFLCFLVGLADDRGGKRLSAPVKGGATLVFLVLSRPEPWRSPSTFVWLALAWLALHAMNTVDHANGLSGLVALAAAAAACAAAIAIDAAWPSGLAAALGGAAAGFLFLNFPRGRVYLGDSGTLLLGGCLATALLERRRPELLLLAAVPLADLLSVAVLRVRAGAKPWIGDRRHVTHRLIERGVPAAAAVLGLALVQVACSAGAVIALVHRGTIESGESGESGPTAPTEPTVWVATLAVIGALALGMLCVRPARPPA